MTDEDEMLPVELATQLTIAWLNNPNNRAAAEDVPNFLRTMYATVTELAGGAEAPVESNTVREYAPAVSVRRSLSSKDHIVSLIDGKPYKTLTRHLTTNGLTPAEYRQRYGLKSDYPMVAENYSARRRELAKKIGLGRKAGSSPAAKPASSSVKQKSKTGGRSTGPKSKAADAAQAKSAE